MTSQDFPKEYCLFTIVFHFLGISGESWETLGKILPKKEALGSLGKLWEVLGIRQNE